MTAEALANFSLSDFTAGRYTRPVYRMGSGPAVIVIHEMPGLHPLVARFGERIAAAGMTAVLPSLFGEPGREISNGYAAREFFKGACIRREFNAWSAGRSSPIVDWLRVLAREEHERCGGLGVGAVGMCFTGGFALAMMTEPAVRAPVLSQPSMPVPFGAKRRAGIDASEAEIATANVVVELGPGTGGTTKALLQAMRPDAKLLAIEINPGFCDLLRDTIDDPRLIVHHGSAADIPEALA